MADCFSELTEGQLVLVDNTEDVNKRGIYRVEKVLALEKLNTS